MHRRSLAVLLAVAPLAVPAMARADGESVNGFPSWAERVLHQWTNRARSDPAFEMAACGASCGEAACYQPMAPLAFSVAAGRAARFHADELRLQGYFAHESRCTVVSNISTVYPATCNGAASCACVGGTMTCNPTCTAWNERVQLFGASPSGEVIASPSDPSSAFYLWLREPSASTACAYSLANGHRWLILKSTGAVGAGVSGVSVMDFTGGTAGKLASGSHYPRQAASVEAWASWYDGAGPTAGAVVVDGACTAMTLERGTPQNGAWRAVLTGYGSGCHRYWFGFRDSSGALVTWPTTGSLGLGDASCADWSSERPALAEGCETLQACEPGAAAACDDGNPCTVDACQAETGCSHAPASAATECSDGLTCNGAEHCDGAGACAAGGTCDTTPADPGSAGCSCGGEAGPSGLVLALAGLLAARRRRRVAPGKPLDTLTGGQ